VQTSRDGRAWDAGFAVSGRSTRLDARDGQTRFVRVVATNAGGVSFASEVVGARKSSDGRAAVLIVDAFDRFETGQLEWEAMPFTLGNIRRMNTDRINPSDIVVPHGRAVAAARWPFDSISDERLGDIDLSGYEVIIWATGEESTGDETVSTAQQQALRAYWDHGGAVWISGAEVLWDLDARGTASDKAFAAEVLGATLASDDAETDQASGAGVLAGLDLGFGPGGAPYPVEWPDVLASSRGVVARYGNGGIAGVLGQRVALFGFPFEAINDPTARDEVARLLLHELAPGYEPPDDVDTGDPGDTGSSGRPNRSGVGDPDRPSIDEPDGCGCQSTPSTAWWALLSVALLVLRRRR
jgi:MYXO-CTERM domain-containing protein